MNLFSKLKDYNNILEEILDRKTFSSVSKSLLLSMIYKLEISYKDYSKVKIGSIEKDIFLNHLIEIIQNYCDHIKTVEPESFQASLLIENNVDAVTNIKERSILTYPTELAMLYAISDIEPKYFFVKKDFLLKNILQKVLVEGYKQNTVEVLKNFNGWSWDINLKENQNYIINMIYQNLIIIMKEQFLYEWRIDNKAKKDYLQELRNSVKKVTGNDDYYETLCKLLFVISSKKDKIKIQEQIEEKKKSNNEDEKKELDFYQNLIECNQSEYEILIKLQKCFLKYLEKKISKITFREDIIEIIYQLRYYQNIVLFEGVLVKDYAELKKDLDKILKLAITKACKMGVIKIISMDIETNFELIKYILDTRIINLEEIKICLEFEDKNTIFIKVLDKEVFEKQGKNKFNGNKKDIIIKKNKVIKLFN